MRRARILLADDHNIVLDGFKRLLEPLYEVVGMAKDGRQLLVLAERTNPEVIVADIAMPNLNGLDACERLKEQRPDMKLVFITASEDAELAAEGIRRGAAGFVLKKSAASELFEALQKVLLGQVYITPLISREPVGIFVARAKKAECGHSLSVRQREVLQLLAEGRSMKEAASILNVTTRTIAFHKYAMMDQLGFKAGAELVQHAVKLGLVADKSPLQRR